VLNGLILDKRFYQKNKKSKPEIINYMYPGIGYGGSCFPKDVKGFVNFAKLKNSRLKILEQAEIVNYEQPLLISKKISNIFGKSFFKKKILFLGITFKENTNDIRNSTPVILFKEIYKMNPSVDLYDPLINVNISYDSIKDGGLLIHPLTIDTNEEYSAYPISAKYSQSLLALPSIDFKNPFKDSSLVSIAHIDKEAKLFYRIVEGTTKSKFIAYEKPFNIKKSCSIEAYAQLGEVQSKIVTSKAQKTVITYSVSYHTPFLNSYTGGGKEALVDGLYGASDFRLNTAWQGFQDTDMECIVDLKKPSNLQQIGLNCLQDVRAWILFPPEVSFYKSDDQQHWTLIGTVKNKIENGEKEILQISRYRI
jgi:hypothetical protein